MGEGVRVSERERRVGQRKVGVLFTKKEINKRVGRIVLGREEAKRKRKRKDNKKGWGAFMGELGVELWLDPV